ncbi:MAG: uridine phosphorylase [Oscillospiraceae bacterium]|jgi:uridine phosphorylase|nr:uridine phosphorylase [Oscillospiraceae bacterium]
MAVQYHIACRRGDVGRYVLLPGDPGRCAEIADHFDNPRFISSHREYVTYTGELDGEPVSVVSTGIGGPSTAIAVEELVRCGADTFIRVGTCGGMQPDIPVNDVVIASAAIRFDGTSKEYMPVEFPAVAHYEVLRALDKASGAGERPAHIGVVQCKDSFYGQHDPRRMPIRDELVAKWQAWIEGGCLASEMESATLFILGSVLRLRTGAVLAVAGNQGLGTGVARTVASEAKEGGGQSQTEFRGAEPAIRVAVEALRILIRKDRINIGEK